MDVFKDLLCSFETRAYGDKGGTREASWEAIAVIQERDDDDLG